MTTIYNEEYDYLLFDCETGGTDPKVYSLLSIGFIGINIKLLYDCITVDDYTFVPKNMINYTNTKPNDGKYIISSEALKINKINLLDHESDALTYKQTKKLFDDNFFKNRCIENSWKKKKLKPMGWNIPFDIDAIKTHIFKDDYDEYFDRSFLDVKSIALHNQALGFLPKDMKISLVSVANYFKIDTSLAHNALEDCKLTLRVLECLTRQQIKQLESLNK